MDKVTPLEAKSTLNRRQFITLISCGLAALAPVIILHWTRLLYEGWIWDFVGLVSAPVVFLLTHSIVSQFDWYKAIPLPCTSCGKCVSSDAPWKCGYCDTRNDEFEKHSLINKCKKCEREPKAFICPHCKAVNFLDSHNIGDHAAKMVAATNQAPEPLAADPSIEKQKARLERKAELEHEIEITRLAAQLEELKSSPVFRKEVADQEGALSKRFTQFEKHTIGVHMFAKKKREEYEEQFKDDPEFLEQMNEALTGFVEEELVSIPEDPK